MVMSRSPVLVAYTRVRELASDELDNIPPAELHQVNEMRARARRQQYLCARALLRLALQRWTGDSAQSHRLTTTEEGKPMCIDGPAVSVTHSGDLIACAVSDSAEIGIDLEVPRRRRGVAGIARTYFSREEASWLESQPEDRFYMLWVLKEAYLKAIGRGLLGGLDRLRCKVLPPRIEVSVEGAPLPGLGLYAMGEAFLALATTPSPLETVTFERWDLRAARPEASRDFHSVATSDAIGE